MKRKILSLSLVLVAVFCFACGGAVKCSLVASQEERVVISVEETDGNGTLLNCMEYLTEKEKGFSYKLVGGMVTEINGRANAADFSSCWMLYTSDEEMANAEWGTVEYDGETLGSAIVGAETLVVEEGEIYVWVYMSF